MTIKEYTFNVKLFATIRVKAETVKKARAMIIKHVTSANANFGACANFGAWPNGDPIVAEVTIDDDKLPVLEINGERV